MSTQNTYTNALNEKKRPKMTQIDHILRLGAHIDVASKFSVNYITSLLVHDLYALIPTRNENVLSIVHSSRRCSQEDFNNRRRTQRMCRCILSEKGFEYEKNHDATKDLSTGPGPRLRRPVGHSEGKSR